MVRAGAPAPVKDARLLVPVYVVAITLAGVAVAQLVMFEAFTEMIIRYVNMGSQLGAVVAVSLVALEIASLPFLLRLRLSLLARRLSAWSLLKAPIVWFIVLMIGLTHSDTARIVLTLPIVVLWMVFAAWDFVILGGRRLLAGPERHV